MAINPAAIAEGIVGLILSTSSVDVVKIMDQASSEPIFTQNPDGSINQTPTGVWSPQIFAQARPLSATVRQISRVMDHPLEIGQLISDYKVILPIEIEIPVIIPSAYYLGTYQQIVNAYTTSRLLIVQTRTSSYQNMIISEMPHQEDPERYDAITLLLKFRQVQLVQPSVTGTPANPNYAPANPTQAPTQNAGQQPGNTVAGVATSTGTKTLPYAPENSPLSPETQVIEIQTQSGSQIIPLYPNNNALTTGGATNGLLQNSSNIDVSGVATTGQAQAAGNVLTLSGPQSLGVQGGL